MRPKKLGDVLKIVSPRKMQGYIPQQLQSIQRPAQQITLKVAQPRQIALHGIFCPY